MKNKIHLSVKQDAENKERYTVEFDEKPKTCESVCCKVVAVVGICLCFAGIAGILLATIFYQFKDADWILSLIAASLVIVLMVFLLLILKIQTSCLKYERKAALVEQSLDVIKSFLNSSRKENIDSALENYFSTLSDL